MATALPYGSLVTFVEAPVFTRKLSGYLDDEAYTALQWALTLHPEAGAIIPGSGGVRKLGWQRSRQAWRTSGDLLLAQTCG